MRIFVLCTGRCGSMTFAKACSHITNYTSAHESGSYVDGSYPDNHIEVDYRLSWFLGTLACKYPEAQYVSLNRNKRDVVDSFVRRGISHSPILNAYTQGIIQPQFKAANPTEWLKKAVEHYVETVDANVGHFLEGRDGWWNIDIEQPLKHFGQFWRQIGADGDLDAACAEFDKRYNRG